MRKAISIYGDKEYITSVNAKWVFFKFPDGSQDAIRSRKQELVNVLEWIHTEMYFYNRMYNEAREIYETEKEKFNKTKHYYSVKEIHDACLKNRFANIDMEMSNEEYIREWDRISGKSDIVNKANNKYWELYQIAEQIQIAIRVM